MVSALSTCLGLVTLARTCMSYTTPRKRKCLLTRRSLATRHASLTMKHRLTHQSHGSSRTVQNPHIFIVTILYFCAFYVLIMGRRKVKSDTTKPKRQLIRITIRKKKKFTAGEAQWIELRPANPIQVPERALAWVAGQVLRRSIRGNHTLMFLSLCFSLPSPL